MAPRVRSPATDLFRIFSSTTQYICRQCRYASVTATATSAPSIDHDVPIQAVAPLITYPPTQPPSYKPADFRKSQLHRQYQSALRSTELMIFLQHNNLKALEWSAIRRELATALRAIDAQQAEAGNNSYLGDSIKLQIVQTGIFASAMKVVEFWTPKFESNENENENENQKLEGQHIPGQYKFSHGLSKSAWRKTRSLKSETGLDTLMSGPIAILTFPVVSPQHLKAALSILAPSSGFPAPKRKTSPTYFEPAVQSGLQKLMLLGARIEGKAFDAEGVRWVGGIAGGLDGLRAQLVSMLSGVGVGITNTLEAAGRTLYFTVEGRRMQLDEQEKKPEEPSS